MIDTKNVFFDFFSIFVVIAHIVDKKKKKKGRKSKVHLMGAHLLLVI